MHEQICAPLWYHFHSGKRKSFRILNLFSDNESVDAAQSLHLPVDVQHLWFQKAGAIARDNPLAHKTAASLARDSRLVHLLLDKKCPGRVSYFFRQCLL